MTLPAKLAWWHCIYQINLLDDSVSNGVSDGMPHLFAMKVCREYGEMKLVANAIVCQEATMLLVSWFEQVNLVVFVTFEPSTTF